MTLLPLPAHLGDALPPAPIADVLTFLARRRSASAHTLTEPGPSALELDDLLHVAARVPDHGKLTPWRFIVLEGAAKTAFADQLAALAEARHDHRAVTKLGKLRAPPMGVAVISSPLAGEIPEWEQVLSAGAVCTSLLLAAGAMGYGANWITDWYAYDAEANALLGLKPGEKVAGFIFIGTTTEPPLERIRPDVAALTSVWGAG